MFLTRFKVILTHLSPKIYLGTILATALVYAGLDLLPVYSLFPDVESRIVQAIWQSLLWAIHSIFIAFFISYGLGVAFKILQPGFLNFFLKYFPEFLATKLRTMIKTSLWGLLLIIPGLIMALRYSLAEMVVFFNPQFLEDRTQDPLKISSKKVGNSLPILALLSLLFFIIPLIFDSSFSHAHLLYEPQGRVFQIILYSFLNLITYIYLFSLFYNFKENNNNV